MIFRWLFLLSSLIRGYLYYADEYVKQRNIYLWTQNGYRMINIFFYNIYCCDMTVIFWLMNILIFDLLFELHWHQSAILLQGLRCLLSLGIYTYTYSLCQKQCTLAFAFSFLPTQLIYLVCIICSPLYHTHIIVLGFLFSLLLAHVHYSKQSLFQHISIDKL